MKRLLEGLYQITPEKKMWAMILEVRKTDETVADVLKNDERIKEFPHIQKSVDRALELRISEGTPFYEEYGTF